MIDDWHKRYEAAHEEACAARLEWGEADRAMARANARRHNAERRLDALFREKMDELAAGWRFPRKEKA
jgi:hypothetical protein